jgi:anti-sigma-K factor RskA
MKSKLNKSDQALAARYADGEMTGDERADFQQRLAREPGLQRVVREVEELSSWFRRGGNLPVPVNVPSPGFNHSVIVAARQLPTRDELLAQDVRELAAEVDLVSYSRRVSFAAAVVFGFAVLLFTSVRIQSDASRLEATSDELSQEMERLDEAFKTEFGGVGTRGR